MEIVEMIWMAFGVVEMGCRIALILVLLAIMIVILKKLIKGWLRDR